MMKGVHMPEDHRHKAQICFYEAVTNAVTHGNQFDESKNVYIQRELEDSKLIFKIIDQGTGFDFSQINNPTKDKHIKNPNGRGLFLVNEMACKSEYCNQTMTLVLEFNF
jgi:serine/threonine-protein kinase RsbW